MNFRAILLGAVLGCLAPLASADMFAPSPSCGKPIKPYKFGSQWEVDNYNNEVDRYRRCIKAFIEEQKVAVQNHRQAIDDALEQWNSFVRSQN